MKTYSNKINVLEIGYIQYIRIRPIYSRRTLKATDFVYIKGSPYRMKYRHISDRVFVMK